jgi:hypothetical protein
MCTIQYTTEPSFLDEIYPRPCTNAARYFPAIAGRQHLGGALSLIQLLRRSSRLIVVITLAKPIAIKLGLNPKVN